MAIIGFILSALILLYITFGVAVGIPILSVWSGGLKGWGAFFWFVALGVVFYLWFLLFKHSPFELVINSTP